MMKQLLDASALSLLALSSAWTAGTASPERAIELAKGPGYAGATMARTGLMSEQDLEMHLAQQGYTAIGMIKLMGNTYHARADKGGNSVAIEVDARTGKILSERPAPRS
jgi:hypothetical protein